MNTGVLFVFWFGGFFCIKYLLVNDFLGYLLQDFITFPLLRLFATIKGVQSYL